MDAESIEKTVHEALEKANFIAIKDRLEVGDSVGLYRVTDAEARRLRMAIGSGGALATFMVGVAFAFVDIWLFRSGSIRWMRGAPLWLKGAIVGMPFIGLFMVFMLGRSFEFQGGGTTAMGTALIRKRWLWFFGQPIDAARVATVAVRVKPGPNESYDRIWVGLLDAGGSEVLEVAEEASDDRALGLTLTLAVHLGEVLGKPVRVEGEPTVMNDYAKDAVRRLREISVRGR